MPLSRIDKSNVAEVGDELHAFASTLYPICRSITGSGIRETLARIQERIPLRIFDVPSGTEVFDWTVPREWNIRDAYIKAPNGERIVDFQRCNLHVVNYSTPVHANMPLSELKSHLYTLPEYPDRIPYRTSYYKEDWGFCLTHQQMLALEDGDYEVCIDSTLESGHLTYGECYLPGRSAQEVLFSCHVCHPSLANDNLSGLAVATFLADRLSKCDRHYSYRFLFIPGTIGAITWLSQNREQAAHISHGLVLTCIGDAGAFHYKKSRRGNAEIDRAAACVLRDSGEPFEILDFSPYGYDERQYCSPGFDLPVGCFMRSVWGTFSEYHTSADNLDFIRPRALAESLGACLDVVSILEQNQTYVSNNPYCEPQLGKRNLYASSKGGQAGKNEIDARLWVLNLSDGTHSLLDIALRSKIAFPLIYDASQLLVEAGLLSPLPETDSDQDHADPFRIKNTTA